MAAPADDSALARATDALIAQLGAPAATATAPQLARYVTQLARFGAHTDLVGARTPEGLAEIALADALVLARHPELLRAPLWEIGAGGASLGVPLALLAPGLTGTLVEPRQKRATFLRLAIGALGLAGKLAVSQSRVELERAPVGAFGCALGRAVFAPEQWIPLASRVVVPGGAFAVLTTEPLTAVPDGYEVRAVDAYTLPFAGASRVATWLARRARAS